MAMMATSKVSAPPVERPPLEAPLWSHSKVVHAIEWVAAVLLFGTAHAGTQRLAGRIVPISGGDIITLLDAIDQRFPR